MAVWLNSTIRHYSLRSFPRRLSSSVISPKRWRGKFYGVGRLCPVHGQKPHPFRKGRSSMLLPRKLGKIMHKSVHLGRFDCRKAFTPILPLLLMPCFVLAPIYVPPPINGRQLLPPLPSFSLLNPRKWSFCGWTLGFSLCIGIAGWVPGSNTDSDVMWQRACY